MNTILFDLDGTLTDPKEGVVNCILYALDKLGIIFDENINLSNYIGPPLQKTFAELLNSNDENLIITALGHYRERFKRSGMFENYVYEGIEELLAHLSDSGCSLYVATSKPSVFAKQILDHFKLRKYFSQIYGSELDGSLSNKIDLIEYILSKEDIDIENCFMVGDRKHDAIGAIENGVKPLGILWGYGTQEELTTVGVTYMYERPNESNWLANN